MESNVLRIINIDTDTEQYAVHSICCFRDTATVVVATSKEVVYRSAHQHQRSLKFKWSDDMILNFTKSAGTTVLY